MKNTLITGLLLGLLQTTALTAAAAAAAAEKVSIVVNATQEFGTIDPAKINDYTEYMAAVNLYSGLTTVNPDGSVVPDLAESWSVSDDDKTYTFKLKQGATFQDGTPVKASDVVYTVKRLLAGNEGPSYLFIDIVDPDKVRSVDEQTVEIGLKKVYAPFIASTPLILVLNEKQIKANSSQKWGADYLADHPAGAGPYTLSSWQRASQMVINRYEGYHGGWNKGKPIDEIRFVITHDEATVKALAAKGELGMSARAQANETFDAIGKMPGYKILNGTTATGYYIKMNTKVPPTDDIHVRRAIAYATDYDTVRKVIHPGEPMNGPLAAVFKDAYLDELAAPEYNLEKAKEELAKSKYTGKGPIKVTHTYVTGLAFEEDLALLMQANLEQIGIELDIKPEPWNRITELAAKADSTPATTQVVYGPTYPSPDSVFYVQYHSKAKGTWASMEWLDDPEIDALIDKSRETLDPIAQNALYKDIQRKIVETQADVFLTVEAQQYAASKCLQGYAFIPMQSWDLNFSRFWWDCQAE
ncbi:ABC transporter substrate-binding protein [Sinorhizobium sp. GL28]|uniref:ABC transporter substrate-binding protein n=1 Tax=Sinorhizobium sp. GL28 TaxID=1358418 RepID=UPI00071C336D|nr:ABC transporter substrate-binding protein [Sinorhizobium sp. GL28]